MSEMMDEETKGRSEQSAQALGSVVLELPQPTTSKESVISLLNYAPQDGISRPAVRSST